MQVSNSSIKSGCDLIKDQPNVSEVQLLKHCSQWMKFSDCSEYCLRQKTSAENMPDCIEACIDARAFCEFVSGRIKNS